LASLYNEFSGEILKIAVKRAPIYDPERGRFVSFDNYMKDFVQKEHPKGLEGTDYERDPVGTAFDLMSGKRSVWDMASQLGIGSTKELEERIRNIGK